MTIRMAPALDRLKRGTAVSAARLAALLVLLVSLPGLLFAVAVFRLLSRGPRHFSTGTHSLRLDGNSGQGLHQVYTIVLDDSLPQRQVDICAVSACRGVVLQSAVFALICLVYDRAISTRLSVRPNQWEPFHQPFVALPWLDAHALTQFEGRFFSGYPALGGIRDTQRTLGLT